MPPEDASLALLRPSRLSHRALVQVAASAASFAIFWVLQRNGVTLPARPVLILHVIMAGLLFGWRGGLIAGLVTVPVAVWIIVTAGNQQTITLPLAVSNTLAVVTVGVSVGGMTDLTDRLRRTQGELLEAQRRHLQASMEAQFLRATRLATLGSLARGVAHEINNPLAYLTSNLHSIRRTLSGPSLSVDELKDVHDALAESLEGAARIASIVRAIRVFSSRSDDEPAARVHVREIAALAVEAVASRLRSRATVSNEIEGEPVILGNPERLGQVLMHLLVNAAESIADGHPESNRVTLTGRTRDGRVQIEVADTGSGIPPDVLPQIFDPFFSTKSLHAATGLGLFVSKGIVTSMDGTLTVHTEVGKGSTFSIDLPAAPG
ncbi:MAG TPA: ATP-binding protein [Myxococcaceae bacterium]|nr:ATP-binding protein [Myxococcaceae bacterium]